MIQQVREVFVINISKRPELDRTQAFKQRWVVLREFIQELFAEEGRPMQFINRAEEAALALHLKQLDRELSHELSIILYETFHAFTLHLKQIGRDYLLEVLVDYYGRMMRSVDLLSDVLKHWEASYLSTKDEKTLRRLAVNILHNELSNQPAIEEMIVEAVLLSIQQWREGHPQNFNKPLVEFTLEIGMFRKSIEVEMLERSKSYYLKKRNRLPTNIDFVRTVQCELEKEQFLVDLLKLRENTVRYVEKELITEHLEEMVNFLDYLISHELKDDLRLLWNFFGRVGRTCMLEHRLQELIRDSEKFIKEGRIDRLMVEKLQLENLLESALGDRQLLQLVASRFEAVVSEHFTQSNDQMVKFVIDALGSGMEEEGTERLTWEILRLNPGLDLYLELYRSRLAREILVNSTLSLSRHSAFIERAREHCGTALVAPLDKLVGDVWHNDRRIKHRCGIFSCLMLFKLNWPKLPSYGQLNVPDSMRLIRNEFEDTQVEERRFKEIEWLSDVGLCTVEISGVEHVLSELHTSIVLYVSRAIRPMKREELATVLKIDPKAVHEAIEELLGAGLLTTHQQSRTYEVSFEEVRPFRTAIRLPETASDTKNIGMDREATTDACIVRLLKNRGNIERSQVFTELTLMIRNFRPTIEQVNNCIRRLCDKEYIRLVGSTLHYVPA